MSKSSKEECQSEEVTSSISAEIEELYLDFETDLTETFEPSKYFLCFDGSVYEIYVGLTSRDFDPLSDRKLLTINDKKSFKSMGFDLINLSDVVFLYDKCDLLKREALPILSLSTQQDGEKN